MKSEKITYQSKIKTVEKLYAQIQELFPDKFISLSIHQMDLANLPENWDVKKHVKNELDHTFYSVARRKEATDATWDIVLFGK